jgi:bacterioferritin-associated ferredoxin
MSPQDPERGPLGKPGCNGGRVLGRGRGRRSDPKDFICFCQGISRQEIVNCIDEGAQTLEDIQNGIGATVGPCGGSCTPNVVKLLNETLARKSGKPAAAQTGPTNPSSKPASETPAPPDDTARK